MRDYPAGTKAKSVHGVDFITTGQYRIDGSGWVADFNGRNLYDSESGKWAEIIHDQNKPKSITISIGSANLIDAVVTKEKVTLNRKHGGDHTLSLSELESIYKAYQSLNQ